ncbi:MAG: hypothetical protein WBA82_08020 [Castellaniella sp.]|uniref:hypothetical protein n=1 Tax=Castellaniella sp. TaxID=1955812 RepID=UPI003C789EDA
MDDSLMAGVAVLAGGIVHDVLEAVHKYDGAVPVALAVGALEIAKLQLIEDAARSDDE